MTPSARWQRLVPIAFFFVVALISVGPIRNYDLFWHLATGRWIVEHRALPLTDPFAVASNRVPWVNGEWLFEVALHAVQSAVGLAGLSWVRAVFIGGLFTLVLWNAQRRLAADATPALALTVLAFAGAMQTIDLRPSGVAALFVVLAIVTAGENRVVLFVVVTLLWINVHPSALLAPLIAVLLTRRLPITVASAAALLVNPFGIRGVLAPLELVTFVRSGAFVNSEWLPSMPARFPLLYVTIAIAAIAFALTRHKREQLWPMLLAALFAALTIRHVRNQPLWYAAFPILTLPAMPPLRIPRVVAYAAPAVLLLWVALRPVDRTLGVSPSRFPIESVARLKAMNLRGNIYNPDQFGGFLIWSFYPQRRTLTDGRNELYREYIPRYARARRDERAWRALLHTYSIDLAVDEYRAALAVENASTHRVERMPASLAYWPRDQWALVAYDRAAMVFARRAAFSAGELERFELKGVVPDAPR